MANLIFDCGCKFKIRDESIQNDIYAKDCGKKLPKVFLTIKPDDLNSIQNINIDCGSVWEMLGNGDTKGVFQLETSLGKSWSKKAKPKSIEDFSALISLIRPGCLMAYSGNPPKSMTQRYVDRKNGLEEVEVLNKAIEECLQKTYGILCYQEQSMSIAEKIAGFNKQEADVLRKCITSDTKFISKTRGFVSIDTLLKTGYKNEEFLIMNEFGEQEWKKIKNIWCNGKKDVKEIVSSAGMKLNATKYHQFLTNNGWKARIRLDNEDYLICARKIDYDGVDSITENLAIVLAGIISEGYFVKNGSATFVNYNKEIMSHFEKSFYEVFKRLKTNNQETVFNIKENEKAELSKFIKFGKSKEKTIPDVMMGLTKETTRKFLSFMLACEGGISKSGQFEFSSKSEDIVNNVQLLLIRFGIRSLKLKKFNKKYNEYYYRLYINDLLEQKKLLQELTLMWNKEKINELIEIINNKNPKNYSSDLIPENIVKGMINQYPYLCNKEGGSIYKKTLTRERYGRLANLSQDEKYIKIYNGNQQYCKIKNGLIKKSVKVYDFTIEDDKTPYIIANGIVIHNSIGKKRTDLMAKVEKEFITKATELGKVTESEAKEIFSWIKESQKYSFNKCLSPTTIVETVNGFKTLEELKIKDLINTPEGFSEVKDIINKGEMELYEITLESGKKIECTLTHKFLCKDNKVRKLIDIIENNIEILCEDSI